MNTENFITGYPGSEQGIRRLLRTAMGQEAYDAFFATFLTDFFDEADARPPPRLPGHQLRAHTGQLPAQGHRSAGAWCTRPPTARQGVRDVLDPIDALFDREFPDYAPYPWGR